MRENEGERQVRVQRNQRFTVATVAQPSAAHTRTDKKCAHEICTHAHMHPPPPPQHTHTCHTPHATRHTPRHTHSNDSNNSLATGGCANTMWFAASKPRRCRRKPVGHHAHAERPAQGHHTQRQTRERQQIQMRQPLPPQTTSRHDANAATRCVHGSVRCTRCADDPHP